MLRVVEAHVEEKELRELAAVRAEDGHLKGGEQRVPQLPQITCCQEEGWAPGSPDALGKATQLIHLYR